jgi:hypothetical protein
LGCGERHDVTQTPNELSADPRRLPTIVASLIIPKGENYQCTKITVFVFLLGCQMGPYARMAASQRRLVENYQFLPMDALLASDNMEGLFCFYLHFFLAVTISKDLDQQLHGVAVLVERLRASYSSADGETFRTVWDFYSVCN